MKRHCLHVTAVATTATATIVTFTECEYIKGEALRDYLGRN